MGIKEGIQSVRKKLITAKDKISILGIRPGWKSAPQWLSEAERGYNALLQLQKRKNVNPSEINKARNTMRFSLEKAEREILEAEMTLREAAHEARELRNKI